MISLSHWMSQICHMLGLNSLLLKGPELVNVGSRSELSPPDSWRITTLPNTKVITITDCDNSIWSKSFKPISFLLA